MAEISVSVSPTFRDLLGRFTKTTDKLLDENRENLRELGRSWVREMRTEAPEGKTGNFKRGIKYRTRLEAKNKIVLEGIIPEPLGTFITQGTKPHPIAAKRAKALVFFWGKINVLTIVPKGGGFKTHFRGPVLMIGKGYVDHPGTEPNPFNKRAFDKWEPLAQKRVRQIALNWGINFKSS